MDDEFACDEKLPASPDIWPEEFPGISKYVADVVVDTSAASFDNADVTMINSLGCLAPGLFIDELQAMYAIAAKLAIDEEHELTRGKLLRVLSDN